MFISFEGIEGCGKSTQVARLAAWFEARGRKVLRVREPGGTRLGEAVRALLLGIEHEGPVPEAEMLLFAASRAQLMATVVLPALERGEVVLCDRFVDSSYVYQGRARGLGVERVAAVNHIATRGVLPTLTILLDLTVAAGRARLASRGEGIDRIEAEGLEFHEAVRQGYLDMAARAPERFAIVDGSRSPDEVHEAVLAAVQARTPA